MVMETKNGSVVAPCDWLETPTKDLLFEVWNHDSGSHYKVFLDGRTEGFGDKASILIVNRAAYLVNTLQARLLHALKADG